MTKRGDTVCTQTKRGKVGKSIPAYEIKSITTGKLFKAQYTLSGSKTSRMMVMLHCKKECLPKAKQKKTVQYSVTQKMMKTKMIRSTYQTRDNVVEDVNVITSGEKGAQAE